MFADLKKKKKKKSKPVEDEVRFCIRDQHSYILQDAPDSETATGTEEDLDFGGMKKKKKKKKSMAQFEADLADENADNDEAVENKSSGKEGSEEAWLKSDRDYAYDEVNIITACVVCFAY